MFLPVVFHPNMFLHQNSPTDLRAVIDCRGVAFNGEVVTRLRVADSVIRKRYITRTAITNYQIMETFITQIRLFHDVVKKKMQY